MDSKLLNIRCDNCGAEYRISSRGEMVCRFCGSMVYLSDKDFKAYKNTRDEMLSKDRFTNDELANEGDVLHLWNNSSIVRFKTDKGTSIDFESFYSVILSDKETYIGDERIAIVFSDPSVATRFASILTRIAYPSADIKNLSRFLPNIIYKSALDDGRYLLLISKWRMYIRCSFSIILRRQLLRGLSQDLRTWDAFWNSMTWILQIL